MKAILASFLCLALPAAGAAQAIAAPRAERDVQVITVGSGSWVGVGVSDVTGDAVTRLKLKEERGVEIVTVSPGGPAEKAGLKEHDVVLEFNGQRVDSTEQFRRLIRETPVGRTAKMIVSRDGVNMTFNVVLGERPSTHVLRDDGRGWTIHVPEPPTPRAAPRAPRPPRVEIPNLPSFEWFSLAGAPRLGIEGDAVGQQLGEYFGVPGGEGVLVRSVVAGSPADKAGVKAGDVIVKIENESVKDTGDIRSAVRERRNKASYPITVIRNKKEMTLTVKPETETPRTGARV
jgi:S1-C subfamily serine protease